MKKKFLITLILSIFAANAFTFEIGGTIGYAFGGLTGSIFEEEQPVVNGDPIHSVNAIFMIPHNYGNSSWNGRFEAGFIDTHIMANYAVGYTWKITDLEITPFAGAGLVLPLGLSSFIGCSAEYPAGIGNIYVDARFSTSAGLLYSIYCGSINAGYIFHF